LIGASFRETPEDARDLVLRLGDRLSAVGLGAFMEVGLPSQVVLEVPVSPGRIGLVVIGGLNPIAILEEMGHRVRSQALAGLLDYARLFHFEELPQALAEHL
jgi:repressor of nif and glnA expression